MVLSEGNRSYMIDAALDMYFPVNKVTKLL